MLEICYGYMSADSWYLIVHAQFIFLAFIFAII